MKKRCLTFGLLLALAAGSVFAGDTAWRSLFNGKDLTGWETYMSVPLPTSVVPGAERDAKGNYTQLLGVGNDPLKCFTVVAVDGKPAIRISGEGFGTLTTLESFSNYHLRMKYKWGSKKWLPGSETKPFSSGLLYHAYGKHGDADPEKRWLHDQQFQIQEGNTGDYIVVGDTAADVAAKSDGKRFVYDPQSPLLPFCAKTPNQSKCFKLGQYEKPQNEWNTIELICVGDQAIHVVNGHVVLRLTASRKVVGAGFAPLTGGRLQLQMEGSEIFFSDIEIKPVSEIPAEFVAR